MIAGSQYYVTFDRAYYTFHGKCSYLLTSDVVGRNFSLAVSYDENDNDSYVLMVLVNGTLVQIDMFNGVSIIYRHNVSTVSKVFDV